MEPFVLFAQAPASVFDRTTSSSKIARSPQHAGARSRRPGVCMSTYEEYMKQRGNAVPESPAAPKKETTSSSAPPSTSYEQYMKERNEGKHQGGTGAEAREGLLSFIAGGGDMEFDGGDSGGGVVGDGNVDLEDQHNSPSMLRDGWNGEGGQKVKSAVDSRISSAGANYFGRSTGYAEKKIKEMKESDQKMHKIDTVRAQQLENWHNQRQIHSTKTVDQDGVFGVKDKLPYQATTRLDKPKQKPKAKVGRLDGRDWSNVDTAPQEAVEDSFELRTSVSNSEVVEIEVRNPHITFAPFRCAFTSDSSPSFSVSPDNGTMERRTGPPTNIMVCFKPRNPTAGDSATLIFETEDFKKVYKFVGST